MNNATILNQGLELALEFGTNWLQPIQPRLSEKFPDLKTKDLDICDKICRKAIKSGNDYIYNTLEAAAVQRKKISQDDLANNLRSFLNKDFPWINESNMKSILSQGCYYAYKDGLINSISN